MPSVLCFGEILWDFLPDGLFVGGAPFNVSYHLFQYGLSSRLVSAVGGDLLGEELTRRMEAWKLPTDTVARLVGIPTGYVRATLGDTGDAKYMITENVAWDHIPVTKHVRNLAAKADGVVFGTLAQRANDNQAALSALLDALPEHALRVFDVNLRAPYDDADLALSLARRASVTKLNAEEAARLARRAGESAGHEETHARAIARETGCALICITAGSRGAGLLRDNTWHWENGRDVEVVDTVGAGDAFLACLVAGLLQGKDSDAKLLARACRLGEWVTTRRGATPACDTSTPTP
ncbi:MAG: PfkB family carbohydrate kinase [Opitutaceae bacterium]